MLATLIVAAALVVAEPRPAEQDTAVRVVAPKDDFYLTNYFQYRVGWLRHRIRTDYPLQTVVLNGDTLGVRLAVSQMIELSQLVNIPSDYHPIIILVRFEQTPKGRLVQGPRVVQHFSKTLMRRYMYHELAGAPPAPGLPRSFYNWPFKKRLVQPSPPK